MNGTLPDFPDPAKAMRIRFPREESLPSHFDWRYNNGNWVTPVKDQGDCGSCWDFSAVAQVESWYKITRNELFSDTDLSEQFVLSCSDGTCDGWSVSSALDFIRDVGVPTEACFHYFANDEVACDEACDWWEERTHEVFDDGYMEILPPPPMDRNHPAQVTEYAKGQDGSTSAFTTPVTGWNWAYKRQAAQFVDVCAGRAEPIVPGEHGYRDLVLMEQMARMYPE